MNKYYLFNRNQSFRDYIIQELEARKKEILEFFEVEDNGIFNFNVYIYNTQQELIEGLRQRGFKKDPDFMCACAKDEDHSLNFFEPEENPEDINSWSKEEYINSNIIFHELIHGIQNYLYGKQPEWLTEGIAKYLDGTYSRGIKFLLDNYIDESTAPSMTELRTEFGWHQEQYNAYDYAYLIVNYLIEIEGKSEFVKKIHYPEYIKQLEEMDILRVAINHYKKALDK